MRHIEAHVEVWEEKVIIPTYEVGQPDKNPMFLEKRVYQGSSGKVYPLPVIDKIYDEKVDREYRAVYLENDYLRIMLLPELGGRVQRAYDKTNGYDFVYYNEVIKPALVGLTGPWISGGIEFNWPQHHRPTTFCPTDYLLVENEDGSRTVRISEVDQMYGTKGMASFTLYPDKAYLEIKGQLYNRTPLPQTFLWWANPAVAVNDHTQSIFPPDVHAVMDHGKRAVSRFPVATGVYYKHDYGEGVDISRYKNIPVPTSYMAYRSDYNFVGGYDYSLNAGILHIADHHISPGKKQWTWGSGDFGKAWDRNLTDENGPYIELMTGVYTDNQPDFTWLKPFEEKTFTQYFMPYKKAGNVKNASTEVVLNLEVKDGQAEVCVYAAAKYEHARVVLKKGEQILFEREGLLSPVDVLSHGVDVKGAEPWELTLCVYAQDGRLMLSYTPRKATVEKQPEAAQPAKPPREIATNEELLFTALHLEQYRHATYEPDPYYLEGLKRDPLDSRINNAYGMLLMRRGLFEESESCFRTAIKRITERNPNPYDSEPYYNLGLSLFYQARYNEAFDAFYKATWTSAQQEMAFYYLALIACRRQEYAEALDFAEKALVKNSHNIKARALKGLLLSNEKKESAKAFLEASIEIDNFDYVSRLELDALAGSDSLHTFALMRSEPNTFLGVARDYADAGLYVKAAAVLDRCTAVTPLIKYYQAYYLAMAGCPVQAEKALSEAETYSPLYCFPNKLEDIAVLEYAIAANPKDAKAPYYLGNLFYDKKQYARAKALWESSAALDGSYPTVWRNLSLVYFNKDKEPLKARAALEKAFALDTGDARVLLELDQLYKKMGVAPEERLKHLHQYESTFIQRDDLYVEYVTLLNLLGRHQEAYDMVMKRKFHPWEGGEGKVTAQYTLSLLQLAKQAIAAEEYQKAEGWLLKALVFPENLGEGKLEGAKDNNIFYYLGCVCQRIGKMEEAKAYWLRACEGDSEPAGMMYYNDQPADLILYQGLAFEKLGRMAEANARYHKLIDYGEKHIFDDVKIEYFAVSLPNLQIFEEDLSQLNKAHCEYLIALGSYGLHDMKRAKAAYDKVLEIDKAHMGAVIHRQLI